MKRFLSVLALSTALASSGCAHKQMTNQQVIRSAVYSTAIVVVIGMAAYRYLSGPDVPNTNGPAYQPQ